MIVGTTAFAGCGDNGTSFLQSGVEQLLALLLNQTLDLEKLGNFEET